MSRRRRGGPRPKPKTALDRVPATVQDIISRPTDDRVARLDPVDAAGVLEGTFAVVVRVDDDRYRRRTFLTLKAAQATVERARARGQGAEVVLCRLAPVTAPSGPHRAGETR